MISAKVVGSRDRKWSGRAIGVQVLEEMSWKNQRWQEDIRMLEDEIMKEVYFHKHSHCLPLFLEFSKSQFGIA